MAASLCLVYAGNTAKGRSLKHKPQLCAFVTLGALYPQEYCQSGFEKKLLRMLFGGAVEVFYFLNPCWTCPLTEPRLAGPAELPRQRNVFCCMDHLGSFLFAPIFYDTLILSHFPLQIGPCVSCASWHISIKEVFCQ